MLEIMIISERRLIEGGAAMFAAIMVNHHKVIEGVRVSMPLLIRSLRDRVFS